MLKFSCHKIASFKAFSPKKVLFTLRTFTFSGTFFCIWYEWHGGMNRNFLFLHRWLANLTNETRKSSFSTKEEDEVHFWCSLWHSYDWLEPTHDILRYRQAEPWQQGKGIKGRRKSVLHFPSSKYLFIVGTESLRVKKMKIKKSSYEFGRQAKEILLDVIVTENGCFWAYHKTGHILLSGHN